MCLRHPDFVRATQRLHLLFFAPLRLCVRSAVFSRAGEHVEGTVDGIALGGDLDSRGGVGAKEPCEFGVALAVEFDGQDCSSAFYCVIQMDEMAGDTADLLDG